MKKMTSAFVLLCFVFSCIMPPQGFAQPLSAMGLMPAPGTMMHSEGAFAPAMLWGMTVNPNEPFQFDFLVHRGDETLAADIKEIEYAKLIKYFLAALAVPDTDQWVNLSPYEQNRIIPDNFGVTEMGRDLLAQDYLLKQFSASLTNPDNALGQKFWDGVYAETQKRFGTTEVPTDTVNKVWIVPSKAVVFEKDNTVYVLESHLKVMTEKDYLANEKIGHDAGDAEVQGMADVSSQIIRDVILPALEREVNEGKVFAPLRQVFSGMLLATWYKQALKESILGQLYADKSKVNGINLDPKANQDIYERYVAAFQKGVYNMVREDVDAGTQELIPRKYFSGGAANTWQAATVKIDTAQLAARGDQDAAQDSDKVSVQLDQAQAFSAQQAEAQASKLLQDETRLWGELANQGMQRENQEALKVILQELLLEANLPDSNIFIAGTDVRREVVKNSNDLFFMAEIVAGRFNGRIRRPALALESVVNPSDAAMAAARFDWLQSAQAGDVRTEGSLTFTRFAGQVLPFVSLSALAQSNDTQDKWEANVEPMVASFSGWTLFDQTGFAAIQWLNGLMNSRNDLVKAFSVTNSGKTLIIDADKQWWVGETSDALVAELKAQGFSQESLDEDWNNFFPAERMKDYFGLTAAKQRNLPEGANFIRTNVLGQDIMTYGGLVFIALDAESVKEMPSKHAGTNNDQLAASLAILMEHNQGTKVYSAANGSVAMYAGGTYWVANVPTGYTQIIDRLLADGFTNNPDLLVISQQNVSGIPFENLQADNFLGLTELPSGGYQFGTPEKTFNLLQRTANLSGGGDNKLVVINDSDGQTLFRAEGQLRTASYDASAGILRVVVNPYENVSGGLFSLEGDQVFFFDVNTASFPRAVSEGVPVSAGVGDRVAEDLPAGTVLGDLGEGAGLLSGTKVANLSRALRGFGWTVSRDDGRWQASIPGASIQTPEAKYAGTEMTLEEARLFVQAKIAIAIYISFGDVTITSFNRDAQGDYQATFTVYDAAMAPTGGIDFAQSNLSLQIKRDGAGVPLPVNQQNLANMRIEGLVPVILAIQPLGKFSLLSDSAPVR